MILLCSCTEAPVIYTIAIAQDSARETLILENVPAKPQKFQDEELRQIPDTGSKLGSNGKATRSIKSTGESKRTRLFARTLQKKSKKLLCAPKLIT